MVLSKQKKSKMTERIIFLAPGSSVTREQAIALSEMKAGI